MDRLLFSSDLGPTVCAIPPSPRGCSGKSSSASIPSWSRGPVFMEGSYQLLRSCYRVPRLWWERAQHVIIFVFALVVMGSGAGRGLAAVLAYVIAWMFARVSPSVHSPGCRYETFAAVVVILDLRGGIAEALCMASPLLVCPASCLWWSPKGGPLKRPASSSTSSCLERPAVAKAAPEKNKGEAKEPATKKGSQESKQQERVHSKDRQSVCANGCLGKDGRSKLAQSGCDGLCRACFIKSGGTPEKTYPKCVCCGPTKVEPCSGRTRVQN
jgi:hypothetical protein